LHVNIGSIDADDDVQGRQSHGDDDIYSTIMMIIAKAASIEGQTYLLSKLRVMMPCLE